MPSKRRQPRTPKPLIVEHDGQRLDVDRALLDIALEDATMTLPEILDDLQQDRQSHAHLLADYMKSLLVHLPQPQRMEAVGNLGLWIQGHANGHMGTMRDMLGLPHEWREGKDDLRETALADVLSAAESTDDLHRRDALIAAAVTHLARMNQPLVIERWRKRIATLGITAKTFNQLLKQAEQADDGDPIRALITQVTQANDREPALRSLFEALSQLSGFQLVQYRSEVQERCGVSAAMFERMLGQVRRGRSQSQIIDGQLTHNGDPLTNFAALITHQLILDDGLNKPSISYTVAARLADGGSLTELEIESEEFEQIAKWVPRHWGADAILYVPPAQGYNVARSIKEISKTKGFKRETVYKFTGWTNIDGKRAFLTSDGAITEDGHNDGVRVELGHNRLNYYRLSAPPTDPVELREAVKHSLGFLQLAPLQVTAPLWCAMYGAPLMEVCSLNAVLWIYGPTQSRKSTLTMLALCHFGDQFIKGREYFAPMDWMSTATALEGAMFAAKNVPMVIDDFAPQFAGMGESRDIHKKAHQVVRSVGNRSSRGRANADLTERAQRPPRGIVVATAELPLTGMSIVGRMIYVPVERADVALSDGGGGPLDQAQALAGPGQGMYAKAMAGYVRWLAHNWEPVVERARANHERANQYARTVFPSTQSRLMDYYADLITYGRTALEFSVATGAIEQGAALALGNEQMPGALVELLSNQSARVAGQSPVRKLFEAMAEMVISKKAYFAPRTGSAPTPPRDALLIGWYGYEESRRIVYLRLGTCLSAAREYWQHTGEGFETSTDALQREIFQAHLLARRSGESYTVSVWIADESRNIRVLVIDSDRVPEVADIDFWPGPRELLGDGSANEGP
jgi:hypothetical protein